MKAKFLTTSQIAGILEVPLRKIISYTERGYIEASVLGPAGYGSRRLWSITDLRKIEIIRKCEAFGLSPKFLRMLCSLLTTEELDLWSDLIIDGSGRVFSSANASADFVTNARCSPYLWILQDSKDIEQIKKHGLETIHQ
ncbi:MAG: hypothetical protein R6V46_02375 [Desulfatiglandaceae bacterium]